MDLNRKIGLLTLRLLLGFIVLMQGFGKVFTWGVENVYNMPFFHETYKDYLPDFIIHATAYYTSYVELIAGLLIVIGLKRDYALYAMASVLVIVTFGHGLSEPIWNLSHVMYRAILLITLLLLPKGWDQFSLDYLISKKKN
ncbi:MAG: DoxX family membrane protein [Flavobacteriales bacterium]|nr:DoxX family membrane protein [Flavobacteriales bacterium]